MAGDPLEILDRHLTSNRDATEGFYKLAIASADRQITDWRTNVRELLTTKPGSARNETALANLNALLDRAAFKDSVGPQGKSREVARS